ncbi:Glycosyltransferase 28 domain protein [Sphingobium chlorophenolicum L-1]|uniref:Glycosyltransferase 28 domain protein n=1 Tax=Sphingobium chlorophenolicum L-1 TaxID=690566 RepID=F6EXE5_SPHCR|nr:glycosyltransferase [Sphingobium chlorophenolicum]AEG48192.1 Glycosyltransferase 28 domain protein [Sphingobium chlorophenolicum L-1]
MILVTVGTQLPFDRLIRAMDALAPSLGQPVFAQVGKGKFRPRNMEWQATLEASEFDRLLNRASLIVSHAGTGTILLAQNMRKPLVIMARRSSLGEHRNDHQVATAKQMAGRPGVHVAETVDDLAPAIAIASREEVEAAIPSQREQLKAAIREFVG